MFSSVLLTDGHPKHSASSTDLTPLLNLKNHSRTCVHSTVCSPKTTFNISKVSVALSPPSLRQYLMEICYYFKPAVF
jgi:hypothetical protein